MKLRLYYKFLAGYLLFGVLAFLFIALGTSRITQHYLIRSSAEKLYGDAAQIAASCAGLYSSDMEEIDNLRPQLDLLSGYLNADLWFTNTEGSIIYDSSEIHTGQVIPDFDPALTSAIHDPFIGRYCDMFSEDVLSVSAPINAHYEIRGYVLMHMPMSSLDQKQNEILELVYFVSAVIFVISLILLLVFHLVVYRPVRKIIQAADAYAMGDLKYQSHVETNDELGYLSATLNYMASELENADEYQKKFISNISHDFRSPLTSIRGYLVAMLDGTIPPEFQERYLNIVINETERLNKLTESLLTLNKLDGKDTWLNLGNFDINRVIRDTCATFEGACKNRSITLDLTFEEKSMMVYADMSKIQQVLYNLIDNAIKFSPDGSTIWLETYRKSGKIFVSVKDQGEGISKENIKKIWERFYKEDRSRGKDKKGTGLGLSITRDIINAHNQKIDVISTENVGTEFIFTLAKGSE